MSEGYRITFPNARALQRVTTTVTGADELHLDVSLLPILPGPQMVEALRAELAKEGWRPEADGALVKELDDGLVGRLAPDGSEVVITATDTRTVVGHGDSEASAARAARDLAALGASASQRASTLRLTRVEGDQRAALDAVIQRVYVAALTERAGQLGVIESLHEGVAPDGTLEVTLKVRV